MNTDTSRREFLKSIGLISLSSVTATSFLASCAGKPSSESSMKQDTTMVLPVAPNPLFFKISLAEWSLNKSIFGGKMSNLDFPAKAKNDFGISAVEYVNQFFKDKATDQSYLNELKKRCDDVGVTSVLIMCDGEGGLGETDKKKRVQAVNNHKKWADAAKFLGCHSIRVNAYGEGTAEEVSKTATDGLRMLSEYGKTLGINVIVENHGGFSSNGAWLGEVIKNTGMDNCGTLPDFGNFCLKGQPDKCDEWYDRYQGTQEMMPYAKGVSAKTFNFDDDGNCIETDYNKMLSIVKSAGYTSFIGIEYEGSSLSEEAGILKTKALLEKVGATIS
jgi:sugar phosphate isomerase/epimerase